MTPPVHTISIRCNATGEVRDHTDDLDYFNDQELIWLYAEGNYGCDCNRHLLWHRAVGIDPIDDVIPCRGSLYDIVKIVTKAGVAYENDLNPYQDEARKERGE